LTAPFSILWFRSFQPAVHAISSSFGRDVVVGSNSRFALRETNKQDTARNHSKMKKGEGVGPFPFLSPMGMPPAGRS
jgi:hypothetical protein